MIDSSTSVHSGLVKLLARELGIETYIFGYPLVLMDVTRATSRSVAGRGESDAPINQLGHIRALPDEPFTKVVTPNVDTLYSSTFLDLSDGPMVLELPDGGNRYHLIQMLDAWTNVFASLGTRTFGNQKRRFVIAGPGWKGKITEELQWVLSPTNFVWMIGGTQTKGKEDYATARALQDRFKLAPLSLTRQSQADHPFGHKVEINVPPREQVARMDVATFLHRMSVLMKKSPPLDTDAQISRTLISIGLLHGRAFGLKNLNPLIAAGIESGCRFGHNKILNESMKPQGITINGWEFSGSLGRYGTDYLRRAVVAMTGLGANLREDADYSRSGRDMNGEPFHGKNRYVIHFASGQLPPVNAFWSITLYDSKGFVVGNPLNRFAIGNGDPLKFNSDGSLTLLIRHDHPAPSDVSNWLPAPADNFTLIMRFYWPKKEILIRTWEPPPLHKVAATIRKAA